MKLLSLAFFIIGCLVANSHSLPVESVTNVPEAQQQEVAQQIAVPLPAILENEPETMANPMEAIVAVLPVSLLDVEPAVEQSAVTDDETAIRNARGLGGFGLGLGKFGGLSLGFKGGFGGFGGLGLHGLGLHGFGFKPFFGKHFG